ncbi:zinc finger protein 346-like isoform X2 [Gigantopelta aegis]|uniref:zinc finger protein 346-like isoform X2 n=1 Tax=Gigantopelta aegis TaxID=1735272 RepID=UPI001B88C958|nr:zinc finger protein 346-like isoform X2 [Gigantopelta aegis]
MFCCQACDVCLNSQGQLNQHRAGKSHVKKMNKLGIAVPTNESQDIPAEAFIPKYGGAFVTAQPSQTVGEEDKEAIKEVLTSATSPQDFNAMLSRQFKVTIPTPGTNAAAPKPQPVKRKFTEIYCEVCHVTINSDTQAQQHFQGSKHNKKMKLIADVSEGEATSTTDASGQKKITTHFCHFCNISVNSVEQLQVHRAGSKHQKNVNKLQTTVATTVTPNLSITTPNCSTQNTLPAFETYVSTS